MPWCIATWPNKQLMHVTHHTLHHTPQARLPVKLLGDVVISLDTARRQADERGCVVHLCPFALGCSCALLE
jgi:uncharacterized damage-inducible protein DinB